jgi:hypothetical protein
MSDEVPTKHTTLIEALAAAQGEFATIPKTEKVEAGARRYRYADLAGVLAVVRPVLSRHGIALLQTLEPNHEGLLLHTALRGYGESIESTMPIVAPLNNPQAIGSGLTYMRRYSLCALVGVAADDDDDDGQEAGRKPPSAPTSRDQSHPSKKPFGTGQEIQAAVGLIAAAGRGREPQPVVPPDDAWLEAAKLKVEHSAPDELREWWNSEQQKRQRQDLHKRRADFAEPLEALKARVAERWWECSSLEVPPNGMGWQKWQGIMARTIDAAPTVAKLEQLLRDNYAHTLALGQEVPKAAEALAAKIENARLLLADNEEPIFGEDEDGGKSS